MYSLVMNLIFKSEIKQICTALKITAPKIYFICTTKFFSSGYFDKRSGNITVLVSKCSSPDYNKEILVRELAHAWQFQNGHFDYMTAQEIEEEANGIAGRYLWHEYLGHHD